MTQSKNQQGFRTGVLLGVAVTALMVGCCFGIGFTMVLFPRGEPGAPVIVTQIVVVTSEATAPSETPALEPSLPPPTQPEPTQAPITADGTSRESPIAFGATAEVESGMTMAVIDVVRPADALIAEGNQFNPTPLPDKEYLKVTVVITCTKASSETCSYFGGQVKVVGTDGNVLDQGFLIGLTDQIEASGQLFGGAFVQGAVIYEVVKNDDKVILFYAPLFGSQTYFALK